MAKDVGVREITGLLSDNALLALQVIMDDFVDT